MIPGDDAPSAEGAAVTVKDAQVSKLMDEMTKHGQIGIAAMRSGMDRKTARKYVEAKKLPSELREPRSWRTRKDPFEADWPWVVGQLKTSAELEAKTLFEALQREHPGRYEDGQLRTLQRRVKQWRAEHGPDKEVFFAQEHRPGEAVQLDFTHGSSLGVTILGVVFAHLLCHVVLPYSNWQHVTVCLSESFLALKRGLQAALFELGRVAEWVQTDNSTAATHELADGRRGFNKDYEDLVRHLGMKPRTIAVGKKEQNGDIEAAHRPLKRRIEQQLLLRGSRDFDSVEAYEKWLCAVIVRPANRNRAKHFDEELARMSPMRATRLPEFVERDVRVTSWSTIRVDRRTYSVPSRLIGEKVRVRLYENHLDIYYGSRWQFRFARLRGPQLRRIDYRHVIWSLVQKPGAFARYKYRRELFPTLTFRRAYDAITARESSRETDLEYLRILHLAAATMEADVESCLESMLAAGESISADEIRKRARKDEEVSIPELAPYEASLEDYDELLLEVSR